MKLTPVDIAYATAQTLNGHAEIWLNSADVLIPHEQTPGNPAIVLTAADGTRYGLEVCPIPDPHVLPTTPLGAPVDEMTPEQRAERAAAQQKRHARHRELNKLSKAKLCQLLRDAGWIGGMHPPEKWTKDEVIYSLIDQELAQERAAQAAKDAEVQPTQAEATAKPKLAGIAARLIEFMDEYDAAEAAREVWPEAEGFERVPGGWTFRVGAGYSSVTDAGHVATDPQGTRSHAQKFMGQPK